MQGTNHTWIVVMDSARARIFVLKRGADRRELGPVLPRLEIALKRHAKDKRSDKPGRAAASDGSGLRHAIEPKHDFHKLAKHAFVSEVAAAVEQGLTEQAFDKLVLVAPKRTLGEMRALLSNTAKERVQLEIGKDLNTLPLASLWSRIAPSLFPLATDRFAKVDANDEPPRREQSDNAQPLIFSRDLAPSQAIARSIERHFEKLRSHSARMVSCKVLVEGSHGHHHKGPLYRVSIDLAVPRHRIGVASSASREFGDEDVYAAIRKAFEAAQSRLAKVIGRATKWPPQERRSSSLRGRLAG